MTAILAWGAVSALGEGAHAFSVGAPGERPRSAVARDPELEAAGLARPFSARVREGDVPGEDRAVTLLARAFAMCARALDDELPGWRARRIGLAIGTSSGPMRTAEAVFSGRGAASGDVLYGAPLRDVLARFGLTASPACLVLGACASSSIAVGMGARWVEHDRCDLVLAGGFDALSVFVAAGFEALRATTEAAPPRPFALGRDGMALGEGAAVLALGRAERRALAYVAGFGASCDAVHVTAPDRTGGGLARAAAAALSDASVAPSEIDVVSAHATATPYNDAAESRALAAVLGERAAAVPVHAFKAQIGHALGAAGALETLACADAMARGVLPASVTRGPADPDAAARVLETNEAGRAGVGLKLSAAFGGANAALVVTRDPPRIRSARSARPAYVSRAAHVTSVSPMLVSRAPAATLARADGLVLLGMGAVAELEARVGPLAGAGILVGQGLATLETNAHFHARIRERGARAAEPRRFPYTSPNVVCGECSVVFGLTGPAFALGGCASGALEALAVARDLVAWGHADRIVVLAVDEVGAAARSLDAAGWESGAVAVLVSADPAGALGCISDAMLVRGPDVPPAPARPGHLSLLPLAQAAAKPDARDQTKVGLPICLCAGDDGSFARITVVGV